MSVTGYESSYYVDSANHNADYPILRDSIQADVCVIGGGYTGLSAALQLAEHGYRVVLLEAKRVGWGASGRNGGQVCPGHNMEHEELVRKVGQQSADSLWHLSIESVELVKSLIERHAIQCDLKQGVLHAAAKPAHSHAMQEGVAYKQSRLEYSGVRYVEADEVAHMLGCQHFYGGEYWSDAVHLHPLNYALGLASAAKSAGVEIFENSRVLRYDQSASAGTQHRIKTQSGDVLADTVVLACNGYLGNLEPKIAGKVMPINNFLLATEPLSDDVCRKINRDDVAVADSLFVVNYFKLSGDNRLIWGGGENYRSTFPKDIKSFVKKNMLKYYPELESVKIDYGWGGTLAITLNRMPHFQRMANNVYVAQGYSGHGVALATLGGKLIADAIAGNSEKFDVFRQLPTPTFPGGTLLRWPGLVAGMLYYSMRDRFF